MIRSSIGDHVPQKTQSVAIPVLPKEFVAPPPPLEVTHAAADVASSTVSSIMDSASTKIVTEAVAAHLPKDGSWSAVSDIYAALPSEHRLTIRREWKSLINFVSCAPVFMLNPTKTQMRLIEETHHSTFTEVTASGSSCAEQPAVVEGSSKIKKKKRKKSSSESTSVKQDDILGDDDGSDAEANRERVDTHIESQALAQDTPNIKLTAEKLTQKGAISLQQLAAFVPPFFVPVALVLQSMPGYTMEHLERYVQETRVFELVTLNLPVPHHNQHNVEIEPQLTEKERCSVIRIHGGLSTRVLCNINHCDAVTLRAPQPDGSTNRIRSYIPRFSAAPTFAAVLNSGGRGHWQSLRSIVLNPRSVNAAASLQPLSGPSTLIYFAQLQHIFCFDPQGRGIDDAPGGALCLPPSPPRRLSWHTSPSPIVLHEIIRLLPPSLETTGVKARILVENMSPESRAWLFACVWAEACCGQAAPFVAGGRGQGLIGGPPDPLKKQIHSRWGTGAASGPYAEADACDGGLMGLGFPSNCDFDALDDPHLAEAVVASHGSDVPMNMSAALLRFVHWHGALLAIKPNTADVVMPANLVEVEKRQTLPLREQLQVLLARGRQAGNKNQIKRIRRRIFSEENPDSPLLTAEGLAKAIHDLLPMNRAVTMYWLRNNLPSDTWHLIPAASRKFFVTHSKYFALWNVSTRESKLFIARPSCPPPRNALRTNNFTVDEMLWTIAKFLLTRNFPPQRTASAMIIANRIPIAVDNAIRKAYVGVAQFCQEYPQYFSVTIRNANNEKKLRASDITISLIAMPRQVHIGHEMSSATGEDVLEVDGEGHGEDEDVDDPH